MFCKDYSLVNPITLFAFLALSACSGGNDERIVLPIVDDGSIATSPALGVESGGPPQVNLAALFSEHFPGLISGLNSGETFTVDLDVCAAIDGGWDGQATDPLGRLKCGTAYTLSFDPMTSEWVSSGIDEYLEGIGKPAQHTYRRKGGVPGSSSIYVWGVKLQALKDGRVFTRAGEYVGHIRRYAP